VEKCYQRKRFSHFLCCTHLGKCAGMIGSTHRTELYIYIYMTGYVLRSKRPCEYEVGELLDTPTTLRGGVNSVGIFFPKLLS
jgi:hypothetical protein